MLPWLLFPREKRPVRHRCHTNCGALYGVNLKDGEGISLTQQGTPFNY